MSWICIACEGNFAGTDTDRLRLCDDCEDNKLGKKCLELKKENLKLHLDIEKLENSIKNSNMESSLYD